MRNTDPIPYTFHFYSHARRDYMLLLLCTVVTFPESRFLDLDDVSTRSYVCLGRESKQCAWYAPAVLMRGRNDSCDWSTNPLTGRHVVLESPAISN